MSAKTAAPKAETYVSARAGAMHLGISGHRFLRLAAMGKIAVRTALGELPKYRLEDIERLKKEGL